MSRNNKGTDLGPVVGQILGKNIRANQFSSPLVIDGNMVDEEDSVIKNWVEKTKKIN